MWIMIATLTERNCKIKDVMYLRWLCSQNRPLKEMNGPTEWPGPVNLMCRNGMECFLVNLIAPDLSPQAHSLCH